MSKQFRIGEFAYTPGAEKALEASGQLPTDFLERHLVGDWGDVSTEEWSRNNKHLETGGRLHSVYKTLCGEVLWMITEADRSKTTLTLPDEFLPAH
jgi:hypothetical protein